jgi:hypothetical protein
MGMHSGSEAILRTHVIFMSFFLEITGVKKRSSAFQDYAIGALYHKIEILKDSC